MSSANLSTNFLDSSIAKLKNIPNQFKHKIYKTPILKQIQDKIYQDLLQKHADCLPKLSSADDRIVQELRGSGTCVTSLAHLNFDSNNKMLAMSRQVIDKINALQIDPNEDISDINLELEGMLDHPHIYLWGLEERLLDIIEKYIGLPVMYQGFSLRKDFANGKSFGIRRWHLDWEDRRLIKMIIYLNHVDIDGGPFEYIDRHLTSSLIKFFRYYNLGYLMDEQMELAVPKPQWQSCTGKEHTVVFTDPANIFHRAKPPTKTDRIALTFCYTSNRPMVGWTTPKTSYKQWQEIEAQLNERQKRCVGKIIKY
jgi:hypothetical protein